MNINAFVYILSTKNNGVNVCITQDLKKRTKAIEKERGFDVKVQRHFEMSRKYAFLVERNAHVFLLDHRLSGEWFSVSVNEANNAVHHGMRMLDASRQGFVRKKPLFPRYSNMLIPWCDPIKNPMLDIPAVARMLMLGRSAVYRGIKSGCISIAMIGRSIRVPTVAPPRSINSEG